LLVRKQFAFLFKDAWITVIVAAVTIAPWALAVHTKEPDFWHYFFWVEHIQRFAAENAQHKAPIYYFLMYLPAVAFPWVFLVPTIWRELRSDRLPPSIPGATLLLVLWIVVPFTFFSISSGKLATYILPCFVPFSVLAATGLSSIRPPFRGMRLSLFIASGAVLLFLVALFVYLRSGDELVFWPGDTIKMVGMFASLAIMAGLLVFSALASRLHIKLLGVGASVIPFMLALPLCLPQATLDRKAPEAFIVDVVSKVPDNTRIAANGSLVRATSWSAKRTDIYVIEDGGETTYGLEAPSGMGRFLDTQALAELIGDQDGLLVFCKGACSSSTKEVLPDNTQHFSSGNFFAHYVPPGAKPHEADR
jgi:4-amino-4-deoxy-L-arabinose transferase